jgi:hypothetical protein
MGPNGVTTVPGACMGPGGRPRGDGGSAPAPLLVTEAGSVSGDHDEMREAEDR